MKLKFKIALEFLKEAWIFSAWIISWLSVNNISFMIKANLWNHIGLSIFSWFLVYMVFNWKKEKTSKFIIEHRIKED